MRDFYEDSLKFPLRAICGASGAGRRARAACAVLHNSLICRVGGGLQ